VSRILLVDDDKSFRAVLGKVLASHGHEILDCEGGEDALSRIRQQEPPVDLVISDIKMQPMTGLDLLRRIREVAENLPVILVTAYGRVETALDALKDGAFDYVTKPFRVDEFLDTIERALREGPSVLGAEEAVRQLREALWAGSVVAAAPAMQQVCRMTERVAPTDAGVLFLGDKGTGRRALARGLHALSQRREAPVVVLDCGSGDEASVRGRLFGGVGGAPGALAQAEGGTLVLASVGCLPVVLQEAVWSVLQNREFIDGNGKRMRTNVRIVATAEPDIQAALAAGRFNEDLFRRLGLVTVNLPALRERRQDILMLALHFMRAELGAEADLPPVYPDARGALEHYGWPGNVSELKVVMRHALAHLEDGNLTRGSLPPAIVQSLSRDHSSRQTAASGRARALREFLRDHEGDLRREVRAPRRDRA
jgi:DNA-binding NtrC family response regulator